jgi:hypothetical protein
MGNDEDIQKLKTDIKEMQNNQTFSHKIKEAQPLIWIVVMLVGAVTAWADLNSTARDNMQDIEQLDEDVTKAENYTSSKFNELKIILDSYKKKADSTHDQVLQLKEQSKHQSELLRQLINKK